MGTEQRKDITAGGQNATATNDKILFLFFPAHDQLTAQPTGGDNGDAQANKALILQATKNTSANM